MTSVKLNSALLSKFRGCMIGSLIGDCLGEPFELRPPAHKKVLGKFFSAILTEGSTRMFPYTDDTCMSLSIARSLIENKKIDSKDLAKRFVDEYFRDPDLTYGTHVVVVFYRLKETNFEDVFQPAKMQFNGTGSYGNGAPMRIAPIALFDLNKTEESLQNDVIESSRITHSHPHGYNGAILQCLAIKSALKLDPSKEFDPFHFISELEKKMEAIETKGDSPYCDSLKKIKELLRDHEDISGAEIGEILGNDETAPKTVPTAIYSFLRGMKPLSEFESPNPFVRTIYFSISVGGDTDTIATMAGGIAGAYYGIEAIPNELQERCEYKDEVDNVAHKLYNVSQEETP